MILDELAAYASFRVAEAKKKIAADELERKARSLPKGDFRFEHALCNTGVSFICEVKRASPSKGLIAEDFPYVEKTLLSCRDDIPLLRAVHEKPCVLEL